MFNPEAYFALLHERERIEREMSGMLGKVKNLSAGEVPIPGPPWIFPGWRGGAALRRSERRSKERSSTRGSRSGPGHKGSPPAAS